MARYYNTFRAHRLDGLFILEKSVDLRAIIANLIPWRELERNLRISAENPLFAKYGSAPKMSPTGLKNWLSYLFIADKLFKGVLSLLRAFMK